nr:hypothetical protein [Saprospiraceae bacterium]
MKSRSIKLISNLIFLLFWNVLSSHAQLQIKYISGSETSLCDETTSFEFIITNEGNKTIKNQVIKYNLSGGNSVNLRKSTFPDGMLKIGPDLIIKSIRPCEELFVRLAIDLAPCINEDSVCIIFYKGDKFCINIAKNDLVIENLEIKSLGNKQFLRIYDIVNIGTNPLSEVNIRYSAASPNHTLSHKVDQANEGKLLLNAEQFVSIGNRNNVLDPNERMTIHHMYELKECRFNQKDTINLMYGCASKPTCINNYRYHHDIFSTANLDLNAIFIQNAGVSKSEECGKYVVSLNIINLGFIDYFRDLAFGIISTDPNIIPKIDSVVFEKSKLAVTPNEKNIIDLSAQSIPNDYFVKADKDGLYNDLFYQDTIKLKLYFNYPLDRDTLGIIPRVSFKNVCGDLITRQGNNQIFTVKPTVNFNSFSKDEGYKKFLQPDRLDVFDQDTFYVDFNIADVSKISKCEDLKVKVKLKVPDFVDLTKIELFKSNSPFALRLLFVNQVDSLGLLDSSFRELIKIESIPFEINNDSLFFEIKTIDDLRKNFTLSLRAIAQDREETCQICDQIKGDSFEFFTDFSCLGGNCFELKSSYSNFNNFYVYKNKEERLLDIGTSIMISKSFTKVDQPIYIDRDGVLPSTEGENNLILENEKFTEYILLVGRNNCQPSSTDTFRLNYWYSEKDIYLKEFATA